MTEEAPAVRPGSQASVRRPGRTLSLVAQPGGADASSYHRMYQPWRQLARRSRHLVQIPPPSEKGVPLPSAEDLVGTAADVYVCQRPASPHMARLWEAVAGRVARVYELDDDVLRVHPSQGIALTESQRHHVGYLLASADLVTCSTPFLAEVVGAANPNVVVLPNVIHERVLSVTRPRRERVTVGWGGGSSHLMDVAAAAEPLAAVLAAHPDADMHWVGMDYSPLVGRECRFTPWHRDVFRYYAAIDWDIAIAPLADHVFNYSKSHLRALDAAALGIPVVAQDLPPYREFVIDGVTGYLVRTADEWRARLTELISDGAAREEMGRKAREHAAGFTIQQHWRAWEAAYEFAAH